MGSARGRKKRLGQDGKIDLLRMCAGAVIQVGEPLIRLDILPAGESNT